MSKENPIKKHQYKSGESGNLNGRPKGSLNRKRIARIYLALPSRRGQSIDRH